MRTDENELIGFKYNNEIYYYKKNYQGDIIGIYDSNYELVCIYEYDSYGAIVSIKDVLGNEVEENHIGNINPYRYRSYYYDRETKLYYLNSRYYNPEWGRFINADGIIGSSDSYLGYNLYTYCENNPVINTDSSGNFSFKNLWNKISNGAKKVGNTVKNVYNNGKNFVNRLKNNFIAEIGLGAGADFNTNIGKNKGKFGFHKSFNFGVKNGEKYTSTTTVASISKTIFSKDIGLSADISHIDHGNRIHDNVMAMPWEVWNCDKYTTKDILLFTKHIQSGKNNGTFIGIEIDAYYVLGGHIKIGFNW